MGFWQFLNQWWNLPYLVLLGLVGLYFVLQTVGLVGSLGGHDADADADAEHELDYDVDHEVEHTSLSVGYANIFPVTPVGKAIGAAVQMVGPALSAKALDRPAPEQAEASDPVLIEKLDQVIAELRALRRAGG